MSVLLLIVIYLIFISLGLPDSLIGSAWPSLSQSLEISNALQGVLSIIVSLCTILSSFLTMKLIALLKEKGVIIISISLTVIGLLIFSYAPNFIVLCIGAIPLGLGAGAIDTTLNNYVAIHYKAIHLNWLHAFWGVGATLSPFLVSFFLTDLNGWRKGAICLACIQAVILLVTICTVKVWKVVELNFDKKEVNEEVEVKKVGFFNSFRIRGVAFALISFASYIALESLTGNWFSSMMVFGFNVEESVATRWTSSFYLGMMIGRFLSGILSLKIKDKNMIRIGEGLVLIGLILMMCNFYMPLMPIGLVLVGLGCAPIYPAIIHSTPERFTKELSPNVMSIQIGFSYFSTLIISPLYGVVAKYTSFAYLPYYVLFFLVFLMIGNEFTLHLVKDKSKLLDKVNKKTTC